MTFRLENKRRTPLASVQADRDVVAREATRNPISASLVHELDVRWWYILVVDLHCVLDRCSGAAADGRALRPSD